MCGLCNGTLFCLKISFKIFIRYYTLIFKKFTLALYSLFCFLFFINNFNDYIISKNKLSNIIWSVKKKHFSVL